MESPLEESTITDALAAMTVAEEEVRFVRAEGGDLTDPAMQRVLGSAIGSQIRLHRPDSLETVERTVGYVLRALLATDERPAVVTRNVLDFIAERDRLYPRAESGLQNQPA